MSKRSRCTPGVALWFVRLSLLMLAACGPTGSVGGWADGVVDEGGAGGNPELAPEEALEASGDAQDEAQLEGALGGSGETGQLSAELVTLPFKNGFENGLTDWKCSGNCPTAVSAPVAEGARAGNFLLTRSMATPYRTEVTANGGLFFAFGRDYTLSLRYRFEDWAKDTSSEFAPFQIHTRASDWTDACSLGSAFSTAPFLMQVKNDTAQFITFGGKTLWSGPVPKKTWQTIKVSFRVSASGDGFIEAWRDGVRLGRVNGRNSPSLDRCQKPVREPYFKMGIYKWDWREGRPATGSSSRQLLIDDVRISQGL